MGRDFRLLLLATLAIFSCFAPLLSVVPLWAASGGAQNGGVGATTGAMMAATVAVQLAMPRILRVLSLRRASVVGALLLGVPTWAYLVTPEVGWVLAVSAVRGVGFGIVVVAGSALVAELVPPERRGRGVGAYGVAVGLPQIVLLPAAVGVVEHVGFTAVFVVAGACGVLGAVLMALTRGAQPVPVSRDVPRQEPSDVVTVRLRTFARPGVLLLAASCAFGGATAFVPLALDAGVASWVLLSVSAASTLGRWWAGVRADKEGVGALLPLSVAACAVGAAGIALASGALAGAAVTLVAIASGVLYGLGFGALQNDTLVIMFRDAGPEGSGTASTAWNVGYDAGTGVGSTGAGLVAQGVGLSAALGVCALPLVACLPVALGLRRRLLARRP
ncbi:MFS transporter [Isoptericola jiangsuensis]|uniref:MFS transporter n=1 Tax=Isoptericola jiangsuensis TaxID=548579 RepID=UPI003AAD3125